MGPGRVLVEASAIAQRVDELARDVARALGEGPCLVVGLLTGAYVFVADLTRSLARRGVHPVVTFVATSHYGAGTAPSGRVRLVRDLDVDPRDRSVLLVDDVLDSGASLRLLRGVVLERGARQVRTCVLLDKPARRRDGFAADHVGFEIPDAWVIGYGMDHQGRWRELPDVVELKGWDKARGRDR